MSLVAALALAACEVPLDPIAPSDFHFSFSGYLDATADTQWVRVERFNDTIDPVPLDVVVKMTDAASGAEAVLTQRLDTLITGPAHLFWTTTDVAPGRTYRLTARDAEGASTATVEVPGDDFEVLVDTSGCPTLVTVYGAPFVPDVQTRFLVAEAGRAREVRLSHDDALVERVDGSVRASLYYGRDAIDAGLANPNVSLLRVPEVVTAVSTTQWPDLAGVSVEEALVGTSFGALGQVENGTGFVGGVVTHRTRYRSPGGLCVGPAR